MIHTRPTTRFASSRPRRSCAKAGALACLLLAALSPLPVVAQAPNAYFEFLMARRLEAQGDTAGALAALERAAAADPSAAEVKAEIASFQLRRSKRDEAE